MQSAEFYTIYILEYLEPWFEKQRKLGKLKHGQSTTSVDSSCIFADPFKDCGYEGEVDENSLACGYGVATQGSSSYTGTFLNNQLMGISKFFRV